MQPMFEQQLTSKIKFSKYSTISKESADMIKRMNETKRKVESKSITEKVLNNKVLTISSGI